jgi:hypothetical protein
MIRILLICFVAFGIVRCYQAKKRHVYLESGGTSPQQLWQAWVEALANQDYFVARELMHYDEIDCGGMELIFLDPADEAAIKRFIADHNDTSAKSMGNLDSPLYKGAAPVEDRFAELWQERIAKFRDALLPHLPSFQTMQPQATGQPDQYVVIYPRACFDETGKLIGFDASLSNQIKIRQFDGRWYITDFTCHAMNEGKCQPSRN